MREFLVLFGKFWGFLGTFFKTLLGKFVRIFWQFFGDFFFFVLTVLEIKKNLLGAVLRLFGTFWKLFGDFMETFFGLFETFWGKFEGRFGIF